MWQPAIARLPDGRLHMQHGPIDLILEAEGEAEEQQAAYAQAETVFPDILPGLTAELPLLRRPVDERLPASPVAQRMRWACLPYSDELFVTPMAAVAGAVADTVLSAMTARRRLRKAYVNNGGDIAFHLGPGEHFTTGLIGDLDAMDVAGRLSLAEPTPVRGIATSGRGGRSLSLGIADAVTVLAASAAEADVAATLIANAVDIDDPAIRRGPADREDPDSDLGGRAVVLDVGPLSDARIEAALDAGRARAAQFHADGLIEGAMLSLRGRDRIVGPADAFLSGESEARSLSA